MLEVINKASASKVFKKTYLVENRMKESSSMKSPESWQVWKAKNPDKY
jgi:hypothetical protein